MGTVSSAKVIAIPIMEKRPEPEAEVATETAAKASPSHREFAGAGA